MFFIDDLSFHDFVDICRKEPVTTVDDLMKAFRKIDTNGDGYISLDELHKIMNTVFSYYMLALKLRMLYSVLI